MSNEELLENLLRWRAVGEVLDFGKGPSIDAKVRALQRALP